MTIDFFTEKIAYALPFPATVRRWLQAVLRREKASILEVAVIFCDDSYLRALNRTHLNHDYDTDVITFDWSDEEGAPLHGDIYISLDRVRANARTYGVTFHHELLRVIVHGFFHLMGYNDLSEKEKVDMKGREDGALAMTGAQKWLSLVERR